MAEIKKGDRVRVRTRKDDGTVVESETYRVLDFGVSSEDKPFACLGADLDGGSHLGSWLVEQLVPAEGKKAAPPKEPAKP